LVLALVELIPIPTPLIKPGEDLVDVLLKTMRSLNLEFKDGDVLAIADKAVAVSKGSIVNLKDVIPSQKALTLSKRCGLEPAFVEVVLKEADAILGYVERAILTLKASILVANAGVDRKNAPAGTVTLWLKDPDEAAREIKRKLEAETGKRLAVLLVDSRVNPLRMGTTGFTLGLAGFKPVEDCRGQLDLYGKPLLITRINIADDLAAAAHLLMGEGANMVPAVIIRGAPIELNENYTSKNLLINPKECLYVKGFKRLSDVQF